MKTYRDCEGVKVRCGMVAMYCGCMFKVIKKSNGKLYLKILPNGFHESEFIREYGKCVPLANVNSEDLYLLEEG